MTFDIKLQAFSGPIDLLLFLVRREEIEISQVSLAQVVDQFLEYLDVLKEIEFDSVGEFIDVASRLVELKSRMALPTATEEDPESPYVDPREDLVTRLLLYKEFRDAASMLEEQGASWQLRYPRIQDDIPPREVDLASQPIRNIELWDLVSAFGRVLRDNIRLQPERVVLDDTPIHIYMQRIHTRIVEQGRVMFSQLFAPGMHKSAMVGVFLAVLELARHHGVLAEQPDTHGEIYLVPGQEFSTAPLELAIDINQPESLN
ncbi:MAG TPA: segregation/condensation protein A [Pirellulaceae bacterium]|nr:segregation/condensation protein A [Pirellulaceae bacterium]